MNVVWNVRIYIIHVAPDRDQWLAVVYTVMNILVS
jgi:hypothetical protein